MLLIVVQPLTTAFSAPTENFLGVYSGLEDVTIGGATFEIGHVLQIRADGAAILTSQFRGDTPTATKQLTDKYGLLMPQIIAQKRIVHYGTWKRNGNKLDARFTSFGKASANSLNGAVRLVFEQRADRLVTITSDLAYGTEPIRLRRINLPVEPVGLGVKVQIEPNAADGNLLVLIGTTYSKVADHVRRAWLVQNGAAVLYSAKTGSGGFENEGESLFAYDLKTKTRRTMLTAPKIVNTIRETKSLGGRTVYVVSLSDSALAIPMTIIIDSINGEVYRHDYTKVALIQKGIVTVATYKPGSFDNNKNPVPDERLPIDIDDLLPVPPPILLTKFVKDEGGVVRIVGEANPQNITVANPVITLLDDGVRLANGDKSFTASPTNRLTAHITSEAGKLPITYELDLPIEPRGVPVAVDHGLASGKTLQIWSLVLNDAAKGDDPNRMKNDQTGIASAVNYLLVYAPISAVGFPSGLGKDGKIFTKDDPIVLLPQGYTLVTITPNGFLFDRAREVKMPIGK